MTGSLENLQGGRIRRDAPSSSSSVRIDIPKLLACSQMPADYPKRLEVTVVESTGAVVSCRADMLVLGFLAKLAELTPAKKTMADIMS